MAMIPGDIRRQLDRLRDRLHGALDRVRPRSGSEADAGALARPMFSGPVLDVEETDNDVLVRAELPGLRPQDFTVESTRDRLIIKGDKGEEREQHGRGFHRRERRAGTFVRSIRLPCEVDPSKTKADYRDGVLRVTLPKTESAKARRVQVSVIG